MEITLVREQLNVMYRREPLVTDLPSARPREQSVTRALYLTCPQPVRGSSQLLELYVCPAISLPKGAVSYSSSMSGRREQSVTRALCRA